MGLQIRSCIGPASIEKARDQIRQTHRIRHPAAKNTSPNPGVCERLTA